MMNAVKSLAFAGYIAVAVSMTHAAERESLQEQLDKCQTFEQCLSTPGVPWRHCLYQCLDRPDEMISSGNEHLSSGEDELWQRYHPRGTWAPSPGELYMKEFPAFGPSPISPSPNTFRR